MLGAEEINAYCFHKTKAHEDFLPLCRHAMD